MKKILLGLMAVVLLMGCKTGGEEEKSITELQGERGGWDDAVKTPYNEDGEIDTTKVAKFEWEFEEYDFGKVEEGEQVKFSYKFKNVGTVPLIINSAKGSCGCTVPKKPEEPIGVGETGEIKVQFNSDGRPGPTFKTVTLQANTWPRETKLNLTGEVNGKQSPSN